MVIYLLLVCWMIGLPFMPLLEWSIFGLILVVAYWAYYNLSGKRWILNRKQKIIGMIGILLSGGIMIFIDLQNIGTFYLPGIWIIIYLMYFDLRSIPKVEQGTGGNAI